MKINPKFRIREIAGEHVIVNQGTANADLTRIISLNATSVALFEEFSGRDFTVADAADFLVATYRIGRDRAETDADSWAEALKSCGIISE